MPTGSSHVAFTMAGLTAVGGLVGYAKRASMMSLVAGLAVGGLYAYGGYLIQNGKNARGHQVSLLASVVLLGAMGPRFIKTRKIVPAGVMSLAACGTALYEYRKAQEWADA